MGDSRSAHRYLLLQAREHHPLDPFGKRRGQRPERLGRLSDDGGDERGELVCDERLRPRQQLVQDDAERPDVASRVDALRASQLLR
jgi:hypothetical protein